MPPRGVVGNDLPPVAARTTEYPMSNRSLSLFCAVVAASLPLAGCGPEKGDFAPPCPTPVFEQSLADLTRYRPGTDGRDLTDVALIGRMKAVSGECRLANKKGGDLLVAVKIGVDVTRGPALPTSSADLPLFVAVTEGDQILDKQVFNMHVEFPSNVQSLQAVGGPIDMTLPVTPSKSGAAYQLRIGFQLTPDELAANQHRLGH
ncbi:MAG: hypothetical protein J0H67_18875 [Rhodospirillales bacterium]|nr:hypothetical protein [Rhodospirillales bacterium]